MFCILSSDVDSFLASAKCDLKEDAINKMNLNFSVPSCGAALTTGGVFFTLSYDTKQLHKLTLPEEAPKKVSLTSQVLGLFHTSLFQTMTCLVTSRSLNLKLTSHCLLAESHVAA